MQDDELFAQVINDSTKRLAVLKLLSNFFNHPNLIGVSIRTEIIHSIFEKNKSLDVNKLELFHLQYTNSLIELFQKLKKAKEQNYLLLTGEIDINRDFISKLKTEIEDDSFVEESRNVSKNMAHKIASIYNMLTTDVLENFSWNEIINFSNTIKSEYYREISQEQFNTLKPIDKKTYSNLYATFERKLLGRLNMFKFRIKFTCGLVCDNEIVEVYEFIDSNDKFVFFNADKSFYLLDETSIKGIDFSKNNSVKTALIHQLEAKNNGLTEKLSSIKTSLTNEVQEVLKSYLDKIASVDFIQDLQNVDEQTNILKAMLNININSK